MALSRRGFLTVAPGACAAAGILGLSGRATALVDDSDAPARTPVAADFPRQPADRVRELVGVCHRDIDRARELLDQYPALVNATWDWGFGDFETALGAAAHTGRRNIAELLLERGARLDIFAAAMLGHTQAVRAMIAASPGIQRTPGPHGIPLLAHAQAGGEPAAETLAFLESLGDAGVRPETTPLADDQKRAYVGRFANTAPDGPGVEIRLNNNGDLILRVNGEQAGVLRHAGSHTFFPAGAPAVRVRFSGANPDAQTLEIVDHVSVLVASRVP